MALRYQDPVNIIYNKNIDKFENNNLLNSDFKKAISLVNLPCDLEFY